MSQRGSLCQLCETGDTGLEWKQGVEWSLHGVLQQGPWLLPRPVRSPAEQAAFLSVLQAAVSYNPYLKS